MPDEDTEGAVATLDQEEEVQVDGDDAEDQDVDNEETEGGDDSANAADASDDSTEGGSGGSDGEESPEAPTVERPTGQDLLALLAGDVDAQRIMATTLQNMQAELASNAAREEEQREFQELIEKGDHAEIGRRVLERATAAQVRSQVENEVLQATFRPLYAEIFSQPEFQNLTAEEKDALNPAKFASDAHYVKTLGEFTAMKRFNAQVEAEVEKRIKARDEAAANRKAAGVATAKSVAASPSGTTTQGSRTDARSLIAEGLKGLYGGPAAADDDEE